MDQRALEDYVKGDAVAWQGLLGYLNFSQGKPDARFQKQLSDACEYLAGRGETSPGEALRDLLAKKLDMLASDPAASAFRDITQASAVLRLTFDDVLPAYQRHHADLLAHLGDADWYQSFFLARLFEATLQQGPPWEDAGRIVRGALDRLNDFVGHRPLAVLETRPSAEPYDHERMRPVPLYLRGAGSAYGAYRDLLAKSLELLRATSPDILQEGHFDLELLDEWSVDPRAYDFEHPMNRRPNYVFGEWDPHHLDNQGRYRRFISRGVLLEAVMDRVARPGELPTAEVLLEAAAVLAGTTLMAAGVSGRGPDAHDSSATLGTLIPKIAQYRDAFYKNLLERITGPHGDRLRDEAKRLRQPFGAARQALNQYLADRRAKQLRQRHVALLWAEMGRPEASRAEARQIAVGSARMVAEILSALALGHRAIDRQALAEAREELTRIEDLLHRGIACGALVDPWNILGFQAQFPLSAAREDSVHDHRVDELVGMVKGGFDLYGRLLAEFAAQGQGDLAKDVKAAMRLQADWWDRFGSVEVSGIPHVHGGEALRSAEHVAGALKQWKAAGEAAAEPGFWRKHLEGFQSPKAYALVIEALLRKGQHRSALGLLINWLSRSADVPLESESHSFHHEALRWLLSVCSGGQEDDPWGLVRKFFDYLEANAEESWNVPELDLGKSKGGHREERDTLYSAAYDEMSYRDSADDDQEGSLLDEGPLAGEFALEGDKPFLEARLKFLQTLAQFWQIAGRWYWSRSEQAARERTPAESPEQWLGRAEENARGLLALLDALHEYPVPPPLGSQDSLVEFDRRRLLKEYLVETTINCCLETSTAVHCLRMPSEEIIPKESVAGTKNSLPGVALDSRTQLALLRGDTAVVRADLPAVLERIRQEPLLYTPVSNGGHPRAVLRARSAHRLLLSLGESLPRVGLLREAHHVLTAARAMEQAAPRTGGQRVTEFERLFRPTFQSAVEAVVDCVIRSGATDLEAIRLLEGLAQPFLTLWAEHSRSLRISVLEGLSDENWQSLKDFIRRYGRELFHARFMTLANLRGILHEGVDRYLEQLRDNVDPLHPLRLVEDLDAGVLSPKKAAEALQQTLQAVVESYDVYLDYNSASPLSDYGENLHLLLEFLRLKAAYDRHAWHFQPLWVVHETLARKGRTVAAVHWEGGCQRLTGTLAEEHLRELGRLERACGMRLPSVSERLRERFVQPLAVDRLCALVEPAMRGNDPLASDMAFAALWAEVERWKAVSTGAGRELPVWLARLRTEVRHVRAARDDLHASAARLFRVPGRTPSLDELRDQIGNWPPAA